ncbi:MAG: helix-turn-helix domain-containing protein [Pseudomonadota bacterium]
MMARPQPPKLNCPVDRTLRLLSGKWRLLVLFHLDAGPQRWSDLRRQLDPITARVLTATLRALEADDLIWRRVDAVMPPQVSYGLSAKGAALAPVFAAMAHWGEEFVPVAPHPAKAM